MLCASRDLLQDTCVVMSIGSANEWEFEESIFKSTNCRIEVFDCTGNERWAVPPAIRSRVTWHKYCVGRPNLGFQPRGQQEARKAERTLVTKMIPYEDALKLIGLPGRSPTLMKVRVCPQSGDSPAITQTFSLRVSPRLRRARYVCTD